MRILRRICAIALIAMLLIGTLIGGAAHADIPDCGAGHCHDQASIDVPRLDGPSQDASDGDHATYDCCDQMVCHPAALASSPDMVRPLERQAASWDQIGRLAAVNGPITPERPPNR